jgi:uncharacterized membrane protein
VDRHGRVQGVTEVSSMRPRPAELIVLAIVVLSFVLGIYFYDTMPSQMASHWNIRNEVDGYMSRFWGLFFMPIIALGLMLLFVAVPRIDPLKQNIERFRAYFEIFIVVLFLFLFHVYLMTILWNKGYRFILIRTLAPAFAVLLISAGVMLEHAKRNWFVGIRTPWTLSSEHVWERTNRLGGLLFKLAGVLCLGAIPFHRYAIYFLLVPILLAAAFLVVYSYWEYRRERKAGPAPPGFIA